MADFEGEGEAANVAHERGVVGDACGYEDSNLGPEAAQFFSKPSDPSAAPFDDLAEQPVSEYDAAACQQDSRQQQQQQQQPMADYPSAANEASPGDFGYPGSLDQSHDLPANFAREAARGQNFQDDFGYEDMGPTAGRGDEAEESMQEDGSSNPFGQSQGGELAGDQYLENDRPIMGYNPFLNEKRDEEDDVRARDGQFDDQQPEEADFYRPQQQEFGAPSQGTQPEQELSAGREAEQGYDRLEEDEEADDADLQMEPVGEVQQPPPAAAQREEAGDEDEEEAELRRLEQELQEEMRDERRELDEVQPPVSFNDEQPEQEVTEDVGQAEGQFGQGEEMDTQEAPPVAAATRDEEEEDGREQGFEQRGAFEEDVRGEADSAPQTRAPEEEDFGIVNQGFDDAEVEEKVIAEEAEKVESERPEGLESEADLTDRTDLSKTESDTGFAQAELDEQVAPESEREPMEETAGLGGREEEEEEIQPQSYQQEERERQFEEEQREERQEEMEEEVREEERRVEEEIEDKYSRGEDEPGEAEPIDNMLSGYRPDQWREEEEGDRYDVSQPGQKEMGSRLPDSDVLSSEERSSFVDNLSELTSPDTIPQPLPSPPEPKDMSPFDPLAPSDPAPYSAGEAGGNLGQQETLFQHGGVADDTGAADFLTAGEVVGETKFGVDGTAVTSTAPQNNSFLHSEDEEDEEEDEETSQPLEQGGQTTENTGTTETETSVDDRSAEYGGQGFEPMEATDNALMSMSMEGSFYDDGGELIGGEDRKNGQQDNQVYHDESITEESISQQDTYEHKQDSYIFNQDEYSQQLHSEYSHSQESFPPSQDELGQSFPGDQDGFDHLQNATAPPESAVNGLIEEDSSLGGGGGGGVDSLLDAPVIAPGLQTPVTEQSSTVDSSVDDTGIDSIAQEIDSSVDAHPPPQASEQKDLEDALRSVQISDAAPEKPEEPSSSVDEAPPKAAPAAEEPKAAEVAAAAAPAPAASGAAGAASAATTTTTKTTVKKSTGKAGAKTTTTTTTKHTRETKSATTAARSSATKKTEGTTSSTTTSTTKTAPKRPPFDTRPTYGSPSERKTSAKATTSPTKTSPTKAAPKSAGPLPSYAQPITPRKPREPKAADEKEKEKKKATPGSTTPRAASATTPRTPRPQSAATTTSTTKTSTITKTTPTTLSASSRTAQLARPKSSPTKLTNGTAAAPSDNKSPTKKPATTTPARPKPSTPGSAGAAKSPQKPASPRTPATKPGEIKSKVGSLNNATHSPGGGAVKIASKKTDYSNVTSKVGSKDKMDHKPGGGNVRIETKKVKVEAKSKIGSLENATHKPAGGDKKSEVAATNGVTSDN